jgi:D-serine deaminase-like pyridoxal phosphate-dependent protein
MAAPATRYERYVAAIGGEALPVALVDLDALDHNIDALVVPVRKRAKTLRVASKSIRCVELLRYILRRGGDAVSGLMAYSPAEAHFLVQEGFNDVLVAYPTALHGDALLVAEANRAGARVALTVDERRHVEIAEAAAREVGARIPLVVDVDVSYRPLGERTHVGVRRSPLRTPVDVANLVERIRGFEHVAFGGLLAYEAQIAGIDDQGPRSIMKRLARPKVAEQRRAIVDELARRGIDLPLFNGGGTGSLLSSSVDDTLTEVAAGSGFLDSHLFDGYRDLHLEPAACFAVQITRRPAPGYVTCQSGGYVASGAAGRDRLPLPYLPEGLRLTALEGAGEVQTPLIVPPRMELDLGAPVFFRHAKAGELAEHFLHYALVRDDRIEARASTYRGAGRSFG